MPPAASAPQPPAGRLRFDATLTFAGQAAIGGLNFLAAIIVARALGPAGRGSVAVALALVAGLVQLGSLGITAANPALTSRDGALAGPLASAAVSAAAVVGGVLAGLLLAINAIDRVLLAGLTWGQLALVGVAVPIALAAVLLQSILLGQGRTVAYNGVQLSFVALPVVALACLALGGHLYTSLALVLLLAQYPLSAIGCLVLLSGSRPLRSWPDRNLWRRLLALGLRSYAGTVLSFLVIRLDLLLVNSYLGPRQAGFYSVAVVIAQAMYLLPMAVGLNILPRAARGSSASDTAQVFRVVTIVYGTMCLLAIPLARPLIHLAFGSRFLPSVRMVYWLLPGIFSLGLLVILSSHFAGRGYPWRAVLIWAGGLVFNVVANMVLLPAFGTYMASIVSSLTYTGVLALHMRLFVTTSDDPITLRPRLDDIRVALSGWHRRR